LLIFELRPDGLRERTKDFPVRLRALISITLSSVVFFLSADLFLFAHGGGVTGNKVSGGSVSNSTKRINQRGSLPDERGGVESSTSFV
jgi:hypothetical protein